VITARKITRSLTAAMPGWLLLMCGVCLAIPLARLAALMLAAVVCLAQPARVRRAASAWKGGKSHRTCDKLFRGYTGQTWEMAPRRATHRARSLKRRLAVPGPLELEEAVCLGHEHDAVP
jgi:hypothetical protein